MIQRVEKTLLAFSDWQLFCGRQINRWLQQGWSLRSSNLSPRGTLTTGLRGTRTRSAEFLGAAMCG
jgi:hypothetical protein